MSCTNRFKQGGFLLTWTLWWLLAIFCAWAMTRLWGFFVPGRDVSLVSTMLSDMFIYVAVLTAVVHGALWLFQWSESR